MVELPRRDNRVTDGEPGLAICEVERDVETGKQCLRKVANTQVINYGRPTKEAALKYLMRECLKDRKITLPGLKLLAEEAAEELGEDYD